MAQDEQEKSSSKPSQVIINSPINMPLIYTNGIIVGMSASDIQLTLTVNGRPTNMVVMAPTTAKSLIGAIAKALEDYENRTNIKTLDLNEISELLKRKQ